VVDHSREFDDQIDPVEPGREAVEGCRDDRLADPIKEPSEMGKGDTSASILPGQRTRPSIGYAQGALTIANVL